MAAPPKKKSSSSKKSSAGGAAGRPAAFEPKIQVFSRFAGCNFQLSPREFDTVYVEGESADEQTDLLPNMMVVQNNASLASNGSIETRQELVKLFDPPAGKKFSGVALLHANVFFAACTDKSVHYAAFPEILPGVFTDEVVMIDNTWDGKDNTVSFLGVADDQLVALTQGQQIWTGPETGLSPNGVTLENAHYITDPSSAIQFSDLAAVGNLSIATTWSQVTPFRIGVLYTLLNKFGPTLPSPTLTFYASKPTSEWSSAAYVIISGAVSGTLDITAVELYYVEGEYSEPNFLAHVDLGADAGTDKSWEFAWTGYFYDTSMWLVSNLSLPSQNYTMGVPATKMASHDGQLYFWGGAPSERIWIGGNPGNRFSVSPGVGGGFVDCEPGVGLTVRDVLKFKTQSGASIVTALCDSENSQREYRFNLVESTISLSQEQSVKSWLAERVPGTIGCKSSNGATVAADGLYAISRYGLALTTLAMEYNSQLRVQYVSGAIEPVFTKQLGRQLASSVLFAVNDIIYMTFGQYDSDLDNVIFCYDIDQKAWWTYTLDIDEPIRGMIHIDHEDHREGIGIVTPDAIYLLPTTRHDALDTVPAHEVLIETPQVSTTSPFQGMHYLSQLEFRFDHFIGDLDVYVVCIDQFGRRIETKKRISHETLQYQLAEYVRIDQVVESYKIVLSGAARMRLTHFMAKVYPKSRKVGSVWGFDSRQSHSSAGSIHRTFIDYNDLKKAIIP
jgi:hypothetical protein